MRIQLHKFLAGAGLKGLLASVVALLVAGCCQTSSSSSAGLLKSGLDYDLSKPLAARPTTSMFEIQEKGGTDLTILLPLILSDSRTFTVPKPKLPPEPAKAKMPGLLYDGASQHIFNNQGQLLQYSARGSLLLGLASFRTEQARDAVSVQASRERFILWHGFGYATELPDRRSIRFLWIVVAGASPVEKGAK